MEKSCMYNSVVALKYADHCIAMNDEVQDRLDEGCGLFAFVLKRQTGKLHVTLFPIAPENIGGKHERN